jgi:hypothetical protein
MSGGSGADVIKSVSTPPSRYRAFESDQEVYSGMRWVSTIKDLYIGTLKCKDFAS